MDIGENPLFVQKRLGFNGKEFKLYKTRNISKEGKISTFGSFLRRTGLDELPQIINILKGDMKFFGPRPLPDFFVSARYREMISKRKPGVFSLFSLQRGFGQFGVKTTEENLEELEQSIAYHDWEALHTNPGLKLEILMLTGLSTLAAIFNINIKSFLSRRVQTIMNRFPVVEAGAITNIESKDELIDYYSQLTAEKIFEKARALGIEQNEYLVMDREGRKF